MSKARRTGGRPKFMLMRSAEAQGFATAGGGLGRWCFLLSDLVSAAGWLEPGATVTAGEATAVARALELLEVGGLVVTGCKAVWKMRHRIRRNPRTVNRAVNHPCSLLLADAMGSHPASRRE